MATITEDELQQIIFPGSKEVGTVGDEGNKLIFQIVPFFNYVAKDYNDKISALDDVYNTSAGPEINIMREFHLPNAYIESAGISEKQREAFRSDEDKRSILPESYTNSSSETMGSGRYFFQDNLLPLRSAVTSEGENGSVESGTKFQDFSNIVLANSTVLSSGKQQVIRDGLFENYAGRYPQHVRIQLSGTPVSLPTYSGATAPIQAMLIDNNIYSHFIASVIKRQEELGETQSNSTITRIRASLLTWYEDEEYFEDMPGMIVPIDDENYNDEIDNERTTTWLASKFTATDVDAMVRSVVGDVDLNPSPTGVFDLGIAFFEVHKKKGDSNQVIQKYYIAPTSTEASSVVFYDTQVLPETEYTYEVFMWKFITVEKGFQIGETGTDVTFEMDSDLVGTTDLLHSLGVIRLNSKRLAKTVKIVQPPLPKPQVSFSNNKYSKDKIIVHLNLSTNSEDGNFFPLVEGERTSLLEREALYNNPKLKNRYIYETQPGQFEMYRMEEHPKKYIDSDGNLNRDYFNVRSGRTEGYKKTDIPGVFGSTNASYRDTIEYNEDGSSKKYYYVFRCINEYGYPSNPTEIYEVELTRDADETFLNYKTVDFLDQNKDKFKLSKSMMKLMQIIPSSEQTTLTTDNLYNAIPSDFRELAIGADVDNVGAVESAMESYFQQEGLPNLGMEDETIWTVRDEQGNNQSGGKRFKIRLVSNDSGRKIDFNFRFILKKVYT